MSDVTELLLRWNSGEPEPRELLINHVYDELTAIAARHLAHERRSIELQPTSLVHEAYIRMIDLNRVAWEDRNHFLAIAAKVMRQVLIDHARSRSAAKRDGGIRVTLSGIEAPASRTRTEVLMLHHALEELSKVDPDRAKLVELRYFGGMTIEETANVMGSSPATVKRNWLVARGWLYRALNDEGTPYRCGDLPNQSRPPGDSQ